MGRSLLHYNKGLKTGLGFRGLKTGVENGMFWFEIGSGFVESRGTPLPRIRMSTLLSPGDDMLNFVIEITFQNL